MHSRCLILLTVSLLLFLLEYSPDYLKRDAVVKMFGALCRLLIISQGFSITAPLSRTLVCKIISSSMSVEVCSSGCIWMNLALLTLVSLLQTAFLLAFRVNTQFDGGYILLKGKVRGLSVLILFHILLRIKIIIIHFETVLR